MKSPVCLTKTSEVKETEKESQGLKTKSEKWIAQQKKNIKMFRDKTLKNLRHRKRPSIQIIGIDEGDETEVKIRNVLNNNIEENFPI